MWGRDRADYRARYPELAMLSRLPTGTVVDGELVLCPHGVPDLHALLARHQSSNLASIQRQSRSRPVSYVLFDVLTYRGRSLLGQPLHERRALLAELLAALQEPRLVLSEGVIGPGRAFFEKVVKQGQEGMMAKHLAGRYLPGRRSVAWRKIKPLRRARAGRGA